MRERIEVNSEEHLDNDVAQTVEQKVEQGSEEIKRSNVQNIASTEEKNTISETAEQQPSEQNAQARNANSFFSHTLYRPCPKGASDNLHFMKIDGNHLSFGIIHGDERVLLLLAIQTALLLADLELDSSDEEDNELDSSSEEENSNSFNI